MGWLQKSGRVDTPVRIGPTIAQHTMWRFLPRTIIGIS